MPPTIAFPLRMLLLSTPETSPSFLQGVSHYEIRTPYYNATIPIWRDEPPTSSLEVETWKEEWLEQEAGDVVRAVGAWIVCFRKPKEEASLHTIRDLLGTIHEVVSNHFSSVSPFGQPLLLAVGTQQSMDPSLEIPDKDWDNLCADCGSWEWIDGELDRDLKSNGEGSSQKNEFGEKIGIERLMEALETAEWEGFNADTRSDNLGLEGDFGAETEELEGELTGLKMAIHAAEGCDEGAGEGSAGEGADEGVEELENMMLRIQAIKDMGADMPESERKNFVAKAVQGIMKTFGVRPVQD